MEEKSRVKRELIYFDEEFKKAVGRFPNEKEKEKMTRCYVYYQNLKREIESLNRNKRVAHQVAQGVELEKLNDKLFKYITKKDNLRRFLLNYKLNFEIQYGRTLETSKDLTPILQEFNDYKSLKQKVKTLTLQMKKLEEETRKNAS